MRRAAKVDANHSVIVGALQACGAQVLSLAQLGKGVPDLLVLHAGRLILLEVKDGSKPNSARKLTPDQVEFHRLWPVTVVETVDQAISVLASGRRVPAMETLAVGGKDAVFTMEMTR